MAVQTLTNRGFVVHYLQMLAAMGVGMLVFMPLGMVLDPSGVEAKALLMATGMTAGMTAWMAYHRHSRAGDRFDGAGHVRLVRRAVPAVLGGPAFRDRSDGDRARADAPRDGGGHAVATRRVRPMSRKVLRRIFA